MSHSHAFQIEKLKNDFDNIITVKREISKIKKVVAEKLAQLKTVYNDLVKTNSKKIFLFCLDSFYFQYKTFAMEMEHIDRFRTLMNNRMYCDYYKLFHIILNYIKENRAELDISELELKTYPVYKDLEPFSEYKIEDIKEIHANILHILNKLYGITVEKTDNIDHYNEKHHVGFSISNFLNTLSYENKLLQEQIHLYVNYMSFFHISQKRQLRRLHLRMQDFYREVDNNINVNKTFSIEDIGDEDRLHQFYIIGEDVTIDSILEDSELLMENSEQILNRLETLSPEPDAVVELESDPAITIVVEKLVADE
jgi:hypothetical protein|uniref:Uncharacterized protein n=1 Tax=viral metagenome TaxID=1070528 RepID=A0A6C0DMD7_9ZZZZ